MPCLADEAAVGPAANRGYPTANSEERVASSVSIIRLPYASISVSNVVIVSSITHCLSSVGLSKAIRVGKIQNCERSRSAARLLLSPLGSA